MSRSSWSPLREIEEVLDRFGRGRAAGPREGGSHETVTAADWVPAVDISETSEEYLISLELPGVAKEDVKVSINARALLIQGERNPEKEEGRKYHRVERSFGVFARSFTLPDDVNEEMISAEQNNGMLHLHMPKQTKPQPKSIEIKVM